MCQKNGLGMVACILVTVGALNWGLKGLGYLIGGYDWNVVFMLLGDWPKVEAVVYVLVGLAGIYKLACCCGKGCGSGGCCDGHKAM